MAKKEEPVVRSADQVLNENKELREKIANIERSASITSEKVDNFNPKGIKDSIDDIKSKLAEIDIVLQSHKAVIKTLRDRIGV